MKQDMQEARFMEAFSLYGDAIYRFCVVKVSNKELAEDMTQEVFMRYWQYLRDGKELTHPRALLYTIAHNLAKDWYKRKKAVSLDDRLADGHEPPATENDAQLLAEYEEVLTAMQDLEEKDREVLILRYLEGLTPKEIGSILHETANVISVRLNRATKRLQLTLRI